MFKSQYKKAYILPIILSLFLIPVFWNPQLIYSFTQGKELLFKLMLVLTIASVIGSVFFKGKLRIKDLSESPLFVLLILELAWFCISNALSPTPTITLYGTFSRGFGLITELFLFIFLIYCSFNISKKNIHFIFKSSYLAALFNSIYAIFQKLDIEIFFQAFDTDIFVNRSFGFLGNPSYLGQFLALELIVGFLLFSSEKNKKYKLFYLVAQCTLFLALIFSGTRTAILGLTIAGLLLFAKYFSRIRKNYKKYLAILLLIIPFTLFIYNSNSQRYSLSKLALRSLESRIEIWKGSLNLIKDKLITGYGDETFYVYFPEVINKRFLTLEEDLNINADRIHNESLETLFSYGIPGLIIYLGVLAYLLKIFFYSKENIVTILSLIPIINLIQNQLAFPDISIAIVNCFCLGALIAMTTKGKLIDIKISPIKKFISIVFVVLLIFFSKYTIYNPYQSQVSYARSHQYYSSNYENAIKYHKEALSYSPYYSQLWYELMLIDPSSISRALFSLEQIEGNSGNVLAWKGNLYANSNPKLASQFYLQALEKNPYHPNWMRAFADMLYKNGDYLNALYIYNQYLEAIPEFWKWSADLENLSHSEQESYRIFFKNTPYFVDVVKRIESLHRLLEDESN